MAAPAPENRACACSTPRPQAGRRLCGLPSPALPPPESARRRWSRVIWCPWSRGCLFTVAGGKPLQIAAVDEPGTTPSAKASSFLAHRQRQFAREGENGAGSLQSRLAKPVRFGRLSVLATPTLVRLRVEQRQPHRLLRLGQIAMF